MGGRVHTAAYTYYGDGARHTLTSATVAGGVLTTTYRWDMAGRLAGMDLPSGAHAAWGYDKAGRLTGETVNTGSATIGTAYTWGGSGMVGDPSTAPAYLRQITHLVNGNPVQTYTLTHSYLDQLIGYTGTAASGDTEATQYAYDTRGRLTGEARTRTVGGQTFTGSGSYSYDGADNLNAGANGWVYDADNRPVSAPPAGGLPGASNLSYDAAGNTLTVDDKTLTYDVWGNLASVTRTDPATGVATWQVVYTYDPLGRRYSRAFDNGLFTSTTVYDYDGMTQIGAEVLSPTASTLSGGGYRGMVFPHSPLFDGQKGARLFAALSHDGSHKGGPHADVWQGLPGLSIGGASSTYPDFASFAKPIANLSVTQTGGDYTSLSWGAIGNLLGLETVSGGQISGSYRTYGPQGTLSRQVNSNGGTQYQAQNAQTSAGNRAEGPGGGGPPPYSSNFGNPSDNGDDDFPIDSSGKTHLYDGFWNKVHQLGQDGQAIGNAYASGNYICNAFTAFTGQDASGNCVSKFDRLMAAARLIPGAAWEKALGKVGGLFTKPARNGRRFRHSFDPRSEYGKEVMETMVLKRKPGADGIFAEGEQFGGPGVGRPGSQFGPMEKRGIKDRLGGGGDAFFEFDHPVDADGQRIPALSDPRQPRTQSIYFPVDTIDIKNSNPRLQIGVPWWQKLW